MPAPTKNSAARRHKFTSQASKSKSKHITLVPQVLSFEPPPLTPSSHASTSSSVGLHEASPVALHIDHLSLLNLTLPFQAFIKRLTPLVGTVPMLVFNTEQVVSLFVEVFESQLEGAVEGALQLLPTLATTLLSHLVPFFPTLLKPLLALSLNVQHLPSLFPCFSAILRPLSTLLVESNDALKQCWKVWQSYLVVGEVGRLGVETWGSMLRRARGKDMERLVDILAKSLMKENSLGDADEAKGICVGMIFVDGMKGPNKTVHSRSTQMFTRILDLLPSTILSNILTALLHHTSTSPPSTEMDPIIALLIANVKEGGVKTEKSVELLSICCMVRRGRGISAPLLRQITLSLSTLSGTYPTFLHSYLQLLATLFPLLPLPILLPSLPVLQQTFFSLDIDGKKKLLGLMGGVNWAGWKEVGGRLVKDLDFSQEGGDQELLEVVVEGGLFEVLPETGKRSITEVIEGRLERFAGLGMYSEDDLAGVVAVLQLLPTIGSSMRSTQSLSIILTLFLEKNNTSPLVEILSACSRLALPEFGAIVAAGLKDRLATWKVSRGVMRGIADVLEICGNNDIAPLEERFPVLGDLIISHDSVLRSSSLRLFQLSAPSSNIIIKCKELEAVPLTVQTAREKGVQASRLGQAIQTEESALEKEIGVRHLVAQFKVRLQPLWKEAAKALAELPEDGELVWSIIFGQLENATTGDESKFMNLHEEVEEASFMEEVQESQEKTFRDPNRRIVQLLTSRVFGVEKKGAGYSNKQELPPVERLDLFTYEHELLQALCLQPGIAEKHGRDIVPLFLAFAAPDEGSKNKMTMRQFHSKLGSYMDLFSKFKNPKALFKSIELHNTYLDLLSKGESKIQKLALDCIFTYKSSHIRPYEERLYTLLNDVRFRDELAKFDLGGDTVDPSHRSELVPLLIRMLYGLMITKRGRSTASSSFRAPQIKKQAILSSLAGCRDEELGTLVELMLSPFGGDLSLFIPGKQQVGFLTLLGDVLKHLGPKMLPWWPQLLEVTMALLKGAQQQLTKALDSMAVTGDDVPEEEAKAVKEGDAEDSAEANDEDEENEAQDEAFGSNIPTRTIRQLGLKRFGDFFRCPVDFQFDPYLPEVFEAFITPRLASLPVENSQAPSGLLELFATWSWRREMVPFLVNYQKTVLKQVYFCLTATNVKPAVVSKVFDVAERLLAFALEENDVNGFIRTKVIAPYVDDLLENLASLVEHPVGTGPIREELAKRQIRVLSQLATYVDNGSQSSRLVSLLSPMLRKPLKVIPDRVKIDVLVILKSLYPLVPEFSDPTSTFFIHNYNLISTLFQLLRTRLSRNALCEAFYQFAKVDPSLAAVAEIATDLNSFSTRRMEEPDFDRRLAAFSKLNDEIYVKFGVREWLPMIYNMLYYVQDPEELSIRTNASFAMRRFVDMVAAKPQDTAFEETFLRVLYPGLRNGLRSKIELVRTEILSVISSAVTKCSTIPLMGELKGLLVGGDEEASFFANIHHIQIHRRTRALRRLTDECGEGKIRSSTLADLFLPLITHFITGATDKTDHHLVNEAITATGRISRQLAWGAYNALIRQYLRLGKEKTESEKFYIRAVIATLDNFHFTMDDPVTKTEVVEAATEEGEGDDVEVETEIVAVKAAEPVSQAMKIHQVVEGRLLPSLLQYLEQKDDTEDTIRIPIALGVVKVAQFLPDVSREAQISRLLTTLSQIFRSKSQETRDLAKDTMIKITVQLGPEWLAQVIREMKGALQRGPQLHVLAFTIHAILVHVTTEAASLFSDLDDCVSDVVNIAGEVIFGESGKDLQAEGFKTKMREVRTSTSKGLDTFQLVSRLVSPSKMSELLLPVREILATTEVLKNLLQVDDVLRRVASGLNANERLNPQDILVLCHTLISQNAQFLKERTKSTRLDEKKAKKNFHVDMKRKIIEDVDFYAANAHKFVAFGLELFITAYRRGRFDFSDQGIIARLEPLVPLVGNTLYAQDALVVGGGLKAIAALIKCPLESMAAAIPTIINQTFSVIKTSGGTAESELAQTALKSLAVIIRDCREAQVHEKQLTYLLEIIGPDIEEPARQAVLFSLLRAIISRKFVVGEIYDLMDRVAEVMVTSQSTHVQELCRVTLMQFLLDYPQGKGRLKKQMQFLAKNLSYVFDSGRLSVMELLHAVFGKFSIELVREYSDMFFFALVMVIANDETPKCREMAAELIKNLFPRLGEELTPKTISTLHTWASQSSQPQLPRLAAQVYGLAVDSLTTDMRSYASLVLLDVQSILSLSATALDAYETSKEDEADLFRMDLDDELDFQPPYQALTTLGKLLKVFPDLLPSIDWEPIFSHLLFPHSWVRLAAARLVGSLFGTQPMPQFDPSTQGTFSQRTLLDIAKKSCLQLKGDSLDDAQAIQVVKNLVFLGRCFATGSSSDASSILPPVSKTKEDETADMEEVMGEGEEDKEEDVRDKDDDLEEEVVTNRALSNPLAWLFVKLSQMARSFLIHRPSIYGGADLAKWARPILSILRLFAALSTSLDKDRLIKFLPQILHPIHRIVDDEQLGNAELKVLAQELQVMIQEKVGTSAFASTWNMITRGRAVRRQARKNEKATQATTNPELAAQAKINQNYINREKGKRKARSFADSKVRERPVKSRKRE